MPNPNAPPTTENRTGGRPVALLTGASAGIGAALAPLIAADGYRVVLVARRQDRLEDLVRSLGEDKATALAVDLTDRDAATTLQAALSERDLTVDVLVNNAGFGGTGAVATTDPAELTGIVDVNVRAVVDLTRRFLPGMLARRRGGILNVASTAAFQPGPLMATYYASKAFVLSFSEAVSAEVAGSGVTVTALCPGPTRTEFQTVARMDKSALFKAMPAMSAEAVARIGWSGFKRGRRVVVAGTTNRIGAAFAPLIPHGILLPMVRRLNQGD